MMHFQTSVGLPVGLPPISHISPILLMGSCFAENMGTFLTEAKFQLDLNPFGILYNPLSISSALKEIITKKEYTEKDLLIEGCGIVLCIMALFRLLLQRLRCRISMPVCCKPIRLCRSLIG